jgi:hypothetical protein
MITKTNKIIFLLNHLAFNIYFLVSYQLLNAIIIVFHCAHSHWCTSFFMSSHQHLLPPRTYSRGQKRWKTDDTESGLWAGCSMTSHFNYLRVSNGQVTVLLQALSYNNRTPSDSLPLLLERTAGFSPICSMSHLWQLFHVPGMSQEYALENPIRWSISLQQEMMDAFIACSSTWFLVDSGELRSHYLWWSIAESCHLLRDDKPSGGNTTGTPPATHTLCN